MIVAIKTADIDSTMGLLKILPHPIGKRLKTIVGKFQRLFLISIVDIDKSPFIHNGQHPLLVRHISLSFNDDSHSFRTTDALTIIHFLREIQNPNPTRDLLLVQCTAGVSRSGAVAKFAQQFFNMDSFNFHKLNPHIRPNQHVLTVLHNTLQI